MLFNYRHLLLVFIAIVFSQSVFSQAELPEVESSEMTQQRMADIVREFAEEHQGSIGNLQFIFNEVPMALLSDVANNRMRIIAPITEVENLTEAHINAAMVSNFHLALDARYAIAKGVLYAAYIHPLKELTEQQLQSAVIQVSTLRLTFGTTYTSGALTFGADNKDEEEI